MIMVSGVVNRLGPTQMQTLCNTQFFYKQLSLSTSALFSTLAKFYLSIYFTQFSQMRCLAFSNLSLCCSTFRALFIKKSLFVPFHDLVKPLTEFNWDDISGGAFSVKSHSLEKLYPTLL